MIKKIFTLILFISLLSYTQNIYPKSLVREQGITLLSYDNSAHRDVNHYKKLYEIFCEEYNIKIDSTYILICFVSKEQRDIIIKLNPEFIEYGEDLDALFFAPNTIIIFEEGDNTFFHELFHYFYFKEVIFQNIPVEKVHAVIYICENLLLVSKSYIEYIDTMR